MSYTTIWDETAPPGSTAQAADIDTVFQNLKRDIRERMNSIVVDWTADPIVALFGTRNIHWSSGWGETDPASATGEYVNPNNPNETVFWFVPIVLPVGAKITSVMASIFRNAEAGTVASMSLYRNSNIGVSTQISTTQVAPTSGWSQVGLSGLTETVVDDVTYFVKVQLTSGITTSSSVRFAGLKVVPVVA